MGLDGHFMSPQLPNCWQIRKLRAVIAQFRRIELLQSKGILQWI